MVLGKLDNHIQKNEIGLLLTSFTKIDSKWIKHINITTETIKLLEKNT